jgi:hypothetical protein
LSNSAAENSYLREELGPDGFDFDTGGLDEGLKLLGLQRSKIVSSVTTIPASKFCGIVVPHGGVVHKKSSRKLTVISTPSSARMRAA